jgi:peptide/nickel transport system substrate-binding protein
VSESLKGLDRLRSDVLAGRVNRRDVLKRAGMLGLSAPVIAGLLAACGSDDDKDEATVAPTTGSSAEPTKESSGGAPTTAAESSPTAATGGETAASPTTGGGSAEPTKPADTGERGGGGDLKLFYWQAPVILNPHLANGTKDFHASRVCLEPLADWDKDLKPILVLGAEFPSVDAGTLDPDGMWVIWKLREGVKWHDGEPFTANDVKFTYDYIINEDVAATTIGRYQTIDTVEVQDDHTIKFNFKESNPAWYDPFMTSEGIILPEHVFKDFQGAESRNAPANLAPIGTGPFKVKTFNPGDVVLYELFEDYWDPGKPHIDTVEMKGGGDSVAAARAVMQSGEYDWAWNLQVEPTVLAQIEAGGLGVSDALPGGGTERLMINEADPRTEVDGAKSEPSTKHPIFSNVKARQALAFACQRDVIAEQLYGKGGVAATNQYDEPQKFTNPDLTWEYNLDKAKELLADIPEVQGFDLLYQTSTNSVRQKTQEIIKASFEQLGFKVELKSVDAAIYFSTDQGNPDTSGKFYADLEMHTNGSDVYPATWFERYRTDQIASKANQWAGSNYFRYSNPEFDKMHDQCRIEMDPDKQIQLFQDMMKLVTETDVVEVPLINRTNLAAKGNRIQGYVGSPWASNPVYEIKNWTLKEG